MPVGISTQQFSTYIETVHRLSDLGAVFTQVAKGTSQEGFDAEWRVIEIMTVEGDLINRSEFFDEADLDAAIARFDELSQPAPQLENAASRVNDRLLAHFTARNWDAMAEILADEHFSDDRRRVANVGVRQGRDVAIANMRTIGRSRGYVLDVKRHCDPRGSASPSVVSGGRAAINGPRSSTPT